MYCHKRNKNVKFEYQVIIQNFIKRRITYEWKIIHNTRRARKTYTIFPTPARTIERNLAYYNKQASRVPRRK